MQRIVFLDNNILSWALKSSGIPDESGNVDKSKSLLDFLTIENSLVYIPSIVVTEFLNNIPIENHQLHIESLSKRFRIVPFDTAAARETSRLFRLRDADETIKQMKKENISNRTIKADCMIVGTAISHKATIIYSDDKGLKNIAHNEIPVKSLADAEVAVQKALRFEITTQPQPHED